MLGLEGAAIASACFFAATGALLLYACHGRPDTYKQLAAMAGYLTVVLAIHFMFQARADAGGQVRPVAAAQQHPKTAIAFADNGGATATGRREADRHRRGPSNAGATDGTSETGGDCAYCPDLVDIQPGYFNLGATPDDPDAGAGERPTQLVRISRPFAIGRAEVTIAQFMAFVQATGRGTPACDGKPIALRDRRLPVTCVSWTDAVAYTDWLSTQSGRTWRLPTEVEWEYAARAGSSYRYAFGPSLPREAASIGLQIGMPEPVLRRSANDFGLFGIHGNVVEFAAGCWQASPRSYPGDGAAAARGDCRLRPVRDAAWHEPALAARASVRRPVAPDTRRPDLGFRVMREM